MLEEGLVPWPRKHEVEGVMWLCMADGNILWQIKLAGKSAVLLFLGAGFHCKLQGKIECLLIMHGINLSLYLKINGIENERTRFCTATGR